MISMAIIGLLAVIAIPNYVSYRNKTYCSGTESDASSIIAAISDYFAIPRNVSVSKASLLSDSNGKSYISEFMTNNNTWDVDATDPDFIQIIVIDVSERCPDTYRISQDKNHDPRGYWLGNNIYVKIMAAQ